MKLPRQLDAGPPPGGPDLGRLALTSSDFGGQATITDQGYGTPSTPSLSTYVRDMEPAGSFADLAQVIEWFPHANEATVLGRFEGVGFAYGLAEGLLTGVRGEFTPVDLSAVGHDAYGGIVSVTPSGQSTVYFVIVSLSSGQAADLILAGSEPQVTIRGRHEPRPDRGESARRRARRLSVRALLVALLAGLLLVPAASASHPHRVKLALVPLPKSALGPAAHTFSVAHDSGPVSNASAASHTPDATAATFKKMGRLNGYALEYGNAFTGAAGITDVRTSIEQYKTPADARRALAFWKKEDARLSELDNPNFSVTSLPVKLPAPAAGTSHFAYLTSYSAANIAPVSGIDEQIADGRYVLGVIVTAGTAVRRRGACAEARQEARRPVPASAQGPPAREARAAAEAEGQGRLRAGRTSRCWRSGRPTSSGRRA